jgi:hypothetical protein
MPRGRCWTGLRRCASISVMVSALRISRCWFCLRSELWVLNHDVQMDLVGPLASEHVTGRLEPSVESALRNDPALIRTAARALVLSNFPETVAPDVLAAVGLDPDVVLSAADDLGDGSAAMQRRRSPAWRTAVLQAWDRQCAFCGYDGQLAGASAGIDAAHVRWFNFGGADDLDNGLALCALHHKLFDLGALGLDLSGCGTSAWNCTRTRPGSFIAGTPPAASHGAGRCPSTSWDMPSGPGTLWGRTAGSPGSSWQSARRRSSG